jgi:DNA repair protein RecO (recombination protein O)
LPTPLIDKAYILHHRPYRDSSLILDLLTAQGGVLSVVARGARNNKSALRGVLQPFMPLCVSYTHKHELGSLYTAEIDGETFWLTGKALFSGFYLNELLLRLLHRGDPCLPLFNLYQQTLLLLATDAHLEQTLRQFEWQFLNFLGYGIEISHEDFTHTPIEAEQYYQFKWEHGISLVAQPVKNQQRADIFSGKSLLALQQNNWQEISTLHDAKRLMRLAFAPLLGYKPLKTRELLIELAQEGDKDD